MKPSIGRIVIVSLLDAIEQAPAIITRVWNPVDTTQGTACVNVKVLPDGREPFDATSVLLFDDQAKAESAKASHVAYWPPRV